MGRVKGGDFNFFHHQPLMKNRRYDKRFVKINNTRLDKENISCLLSFDPFVKNDLFTQLLNNEISALKKGSDDSIFSSIKIANLNGLKEKNRLQLEDSFASWSAEKLLQQELGNQLNTIDLIISVEDIFTRDGVTEVLVNRVEVGGMKLPTLEGVYVLDNNSFVLVDMNEEIEQNESLKFNL